MTLMGAGLALCVGHLSYWLFDPFQKNIPGFLGLFSILFALYFVLVWKFKDCDVSPLWVLLFSVFFRLALLPMSPTLSDDVYRYVWDGKVQAAGINPYLYPPASENLNFLTDNQHVLINHPTVRTVYPPLAQYVFRLGYHLSPTVFAQKMIFVFFDLCLIGLLMSFLKMRGYPMGRLLVYAWNPLVIVEFSTSGHNDSLMLVVLMAAFVLYEKKKIAGSYALFGAAAMTKLIPFVMIPWLIINRHRRFLTLFALVLLVLIAPFWGGFGTVSGVRTYAKDWVFNASFYALLEFVLPSPFVRKVLLGIFLTGCSLLWAQKNPNNPFLYCFGVVFALLLASPVVHPWYVLWLLPFFCVYPLRSGLLWTWLVGFTYVVQIRYASEGIWQLPTWVPIFEYGLLFSVLIWELSRGFWSPEQGTVRFVESQYQPQKALGLKTTVIIPALNEEKAIPHVISEIPKNLIQEVIVVDNGSSDKTPEVARSTGARVIFESRQGYGQAVLTGLSHLRADCDTVVILDGDHSDFPEDLGQLLEPIARGEADMVIGARTQAALPGSLMPQQKFGNWLTCCLIRMLYGQQYTDMGPFRAIRREALEKLRMEDRNFGWNVEMQTKALQWGLKVWEIPVRYRPRIGQSKISGTIKGSFKAGVIILWSMYRYGWKCFQRPLV